MLDITRAIAGLGGSVGSNIGLFALPLGVIGRIWPMFVALCGYLLYYLSFM